MDVTLGTETPLVWYARTRLGVSCATTFSKASGLCATRVLSSRVAWSGTTSPSSRTLSLELVESVFPAPLPSRVSDRERCLICNELWRQPTVQAGLDPTPNLRHRMTAKLDDRCWLVSSHIVFQWLQEYHCPNTIRN
jgi:hypothetical protein